MGRQLKAEDLCRCGGGHRPHFEVAKTVKQKTLGAARKAPFPTNVEPPDVNQGHALLVQLTMSVERRRRTRDRK